MSVEQTFHTPSFGDEEFDIPPLTYAPTAAASRCSGQGVFGNQVPVEYLKRKLSCDQIYVYLPRQEENYPDCQLYNQHPLTHLRPPETHLQQQPQQQQGYLVQPQHPNSPQNHIMSNNQFQQQQQDMYMMNQHSMGMQMQYENHPTYTESPMQQGSMQPLQQMTLMPHQQQQQQQSHVLGPQQQLYSPMNQSQMNSQLSLQIGMGPQQTGGSPPGSNHNSPGVESSEDSDDSTPLAQLIGAKKYQNPEPVDTVPKAAKKPKAQKKKKKRDPNEPQKPVSAYALFFRDTQAAIKGQSPNASFGEVSKIVASMWDSLDIERKNSYKKKTETAKKEYLKQLAAYRANLVSRAAVDQSDSMYGNNVNSSAPPTHSPNSSPPGRMMSMPKQPSPVLTSVVDSMQPVTNTMNMHPQNQVWHMQSPQHMSNPSPPHVMQGGNGMMGMQQQQQQMQQPPMQQQPPHMSPQQQQQQMGGVMNMQQQQMPGNSPQQQLCNSASNSPSYNQNMSVVNSGGNHANMGNVEVMPSLPTCLRNGCSNPAIDSPDWDREYCSSECVVSHCKDVFASWVAQRQVNSNSYSTVK